MKDAEDEAFDELAKKQGDWGGGFQAKRKMAADRDALFEKFEVEQPAQEPDALTIAYQSGYYDGKKAAQPAQDGKCKYCVDGCIACDARAQKEAIYGMNQDDWKDVVAAISKVRDGRGIYLACRPADVFQEWFLHLGTAKLRSKNND